MQAELVPFIPETAPFTPEQRAYLNGFLAGLFSKAPAAAPTSAPLRPLTILFGSQTGNAESLAKRVADEAGKAGFAATVHDMAQYPREKLAGEQRLLIITSTYGDGEPPDNAKGFWGFLRNGAPRLDAVEFSVLALGDSNYPKFCQCGKDFDRRLEELGAKRIFERVDCDVDYDENFRKWLDGVLGAPGGRAPPTTAAISSRKNPFPARLLTNRKLTGDGSAKDVRHIELSLEGSGLSYEVGDALGVWPENDPALVEEFARMLDGDTTGLADCELARVDVPKEKVPAAPFMAKLKKLQPRLYSISSSPKAHPGQVHLTVGVVRRPRNGVCSTYLAERAGETVRVFVQPNRNFRLPADGATPIIMIGPGTGVAPFRAFLHERRAVGASGQSWLFFGEQHAATDFLYGEELPGLATRLTTAFSRDQAEKIYVQHRMLEHAGEFFAWLEDGAHLYVCGDAKRMAADVDAALREIVRRAGRDPEEYVARLQAERRYQRDVY
jgi:sulfite reductase (NADPH) flavoprotein alpha-component